MTRIKICGVTRLDNALQCAEVGADLLGLNFYPPSPRCLTLDAARALVDGLRAALGDQCPVLVGVFVNMSTSEIARILAVARLDAAQLSGDESESVLAALGGRAFKAIRPRSESDALDDARAFLPFAPTDSRLPALLVDAYHKDLYGGTGEQASLAIAQAARDLTPRLMLAGGLTPETVGERVAAIRPWGVDVASGVESAPGIKDIARVEALIAAVRAAEES